MWEFPKIRGTFLGVPIIRNIVYWGLHWGPLFYKPQHTISLNLRTPSEGQLAFENQTTFWVVSREQGNSLYMDCIPLSL